MSDFEAIWAKTSTIEGWFQDTEARQYYSVLSTLPEGAVVVEIGVYLGRTTSIPQQMQRFNIVAVDIFKTDPNYGGGVTGDRSLFIQNMEACGDTSRLVVYEGQSMFAARILGLSPDLVLIDGDHFTGVEIDCQTWLPHLKSGGWALFHDYSPNFPAVVAAVDKHCGTWDTQTVDTLTCRRKP